MDHHGSMIIINHPERARGIAVHGVYISRVIPIQRRWVFLVSTGA